MVQIVRTARVNEKTSYDHRITVSFLLHSDESPGSSNRSIYMYIRRHISTSSNAQFVAKRAQLESKENSYLSEDNKLRNSWSC